LGGASPVRTPPARRLLPGLLQLKSYQRSWLRWDALAGITVAAYLVPQVMAYGEVAGLQPVVGLWAILPSLAIYALLGSSRQLSVGPESTTALMTATVVAPLAVGDPARYATLAAALAIVVGVLSVGAWVVRLGFVSDLLSQPILVGYLAGVAVIMIVGQIGKVTGVPVEGGTLGSELWSFLRAMDDFQPATFLLAVATLLFLFVVQWRFPRLPGPLLAVLLATALTVALDLERRGVGVVGDVPAGLPHLSLPSLDAMKERGLRSRDETECWTLGASHQPRQGRPHG
jgi:sulfate permease, SulP family